VEDACLMVEHARLLRGDGA
jgi:hypothetical protein